MENTVGTPEISQQQATSLQNLFEGASTFGGDGNTESDSPEFKLESEAVRALLDSEASGTPVTPNTDTAAATTTDSAIIEDEIIPIPEKTANEVDYKSLASQYSKGAGLDYDTEKDLLSKINSQDDYEDIVGKMIARDNYIEQQVSTAIASNPLFVPVLQGNANPLEVLQSAVKSSLGKFYSDTEFDNIMETLYTAENGLPTEKGKEALEEIKSAYTKTYQEIVAGASKHADDSLREAKAYKETIKAAVKTTKLLGAVVPSEEMQAELIEAVQKGDYFNAINDALKDNSKKAETELLLAAIANPRLRAMMAKQIFDLGVNSKKNEILKAKI